VYRTCTFSVLFQRKTSPKSPHCSRLPGAERIVCGPGAMASRLQALGCAAVGLVAEYGHPAARDATEGACRPRNGVLGQEAAEHFAHD
jgi:hypothetical protein